MDVARSDRAVPRRHALASPSLALFLALFASQAGVLVLSPILSDVADDFGVSIAQAGQLRIVAAPLAALVALAAGRALTRFSPRALLGVGSALLAAGSVASAAAPTFALLAAAQVPLWAGIATLLAAGVTAVAAWSEPGRRTRVVAHAFAGPPTAWIVGMPLIGVVAEVHWRLAFLALPLPAALLAGLALAARPRDVPIAGGVGRCLACCGAPTRAAGHSASCLANSACRRSSSSGALLKGYARRPCRPVFAASASRRGRLPAATGRKPRLSRARPPAMLEASVAAAAVIALVALRRRRLRVRSRSRASSQAGRAETAFEVAGERHAARHRLRPHRPAAP